jgi:LuxR family maltose regulon positive regulatory protein
MASPILVTKLFIPATRPELVSRSRLIERLDRGLYSKLTLISTPAGFGKTTVVADWLDHLSGDSDQEDFKIAWLSLDEGDNDPNRFLTYLIAALKLVDGLESLDERSLALLEVPQTTALQAVLTPLINEIATFPGKIIFVFDDYHLIEAQTVNDAVSFLLENLPPQMHLTITTREDPLLPLSRLRARGQLTELRAADLRFNTVESADFLNQVMGLNLSNEDITALETRTEGWIAGLQLAAISMQGHTDIARFVKSFTGSHRLCWITSSRKC